MRLNKSFKSETKGYIEAQKDLQHQLDQQKEMWNELKEWVEENKYKQLDDRYIEQLVDVVNVKSLLDKMQELEGEDEEN